MVKHGVIQLLDSSHGRPLQNWKIGTDQRVTVGRALENDIVLADPYVSRAHAYIEYHAESDEWQVISISQHQLVHEGQTVRQLALVEGIMFRLGAQGCFLRFNKSPEPIDNRQTMAVDFLVKPKLSLDQQQLAKDVNQIVADDFFQNLKKAVDTQRSRRAPPDK